MDTIDWLLDSDPAISWQAMRDLTGRLPGGGRRGARPRPREGIGAEILSRQGIGRLVAPDRRPRLVADSLHIAPPARDRRRSCRTCGRVRGGSS